MRSLLSFAALAALTTPVSAQHPLVLQKLTELDAKAPSPPLTQMQPILFAGAKAYSAAKKICVPTSLTLTEVSSTVGARGIFQAALAGKIRNAWTVYGTNGGCPGAEVTRYMMLQFADGSLKAARVNQGRSLANPSIMMDTGKAAAMAVLLRAKKSDPACVGSDLEMVTSRVLSQSKDLGPDVFGVHYTGSWSEGWRFRTCGKTYEVPIEFSADGDGGAYTNVKASAVALVP